MKIWPIQICVIERELGGVDWTPWWWSYNNPEAQSLCYVQLNRDAGLLHRAKYWSVHGKQWMKKEAGLAILKRSNLYRGNVSGHKFAGGTGRNKVNIFCTQYQHSHSTRGSLLYHAELHLGKDFVNFLRVWGFGPWHKWLMSTKCIPLGLIRLRDYSVPHTVVFP